MGYFERNVERDSGDIRFDLIRKTKLLEIMLQQIYLIVYHKNVTKLYVRYAF